MDLQLATTCQGRPAPLVSHRARTIKRTLRLWTDSSLHSPASRTGAGELADDKRARRRPEGSGVPRSRAKTCPLTHTLRPKVAGKLQAEPRGMALSAIWLPTLRDAIWPSSVCHMAGTNEAEALSVAGVLEPRGGHRQRAKRLSPQEVRDAVRNGLPYSSLEALQTALDLSLEERGVILGIPERTIARRRDEQQLTAAESDRLYRVARTLAHAASVLGTI